MGCGFSKPVAPPTYDYYRNGPLRYLGYAGHIGSACSMLLPQSLAFVPQMVTTAYIIADVFDKSKFACEKNEKSDRTIINAGDALLWQTLASIIIPGIVLNGIKSSVGQFFAKQTKNGTCGSAPVARASLAARFIPCALAILAMPFIICPIDRGVDYIMNNTYREYTKPEKECHEDCPRALLREKRREADRAAKELKAKADRAAREAKEAEEKAKKAEKEACERKKREEKEAKEAARKKCLEEAKNLKEKLAAEDKALKEKLKKEEAEFKERQKKEAEELRKKIEAQLECK